MTDLFKKAKQLKQQHQREWLAMKDVMGVGIGKTPDNQICIIISVRTNAAGIRNRIPTTLEGVPIEIQASGKFRAL